MSESCNRAWAHEFQEGDWREVCKVENELRILLSLKAYCSCIWRQISARTRRSGCKWHTSTKKEPSGHEKRPEHLHWAIFRVWVSSSQHSIELRDEDSVLRRTVFCERQLSSEEECENDSKESWALWNLGPADSKGVNWVSHFRTKIKVQEQELEVLSLPTCEENSGGDWMNVHISWE